MQRSGGIRRPAAGRGEFRPASPRPPIVFTKLSRLLFCLPTALALGFLGATGSLAANPFPASVTEAVVDFAACRVLHDDGAEPAEAAAVRDLLGLGQGNAAAPTRRGGSSRKPTASLQYLLVFKQPVPKELILHIC